MDYGKAVKTVRVSRGMSQKDLAQRASVDASYISLVEKGSRTPSASNLEKLAAALDVPMYLLVLLASAESDLRGLSEDERDRLGGRLLRVLIESSDGPTGAS
jgi:transcriptional regulator with XRE-family HTH domain